jgi:S1-C subfamily serine protease
MKARSFVCIVQLMSVLALALVSANAQSAPTIKRKDIPTIAKSANGAIVSIVMSDKDGKPIAQGTGFLVSKDGLIVTNYHVIAEGNSAVVKFPEGAFYVIDGVLASDKTRDIAVIKAHGQNFRTLALGDSDRVRVGDEVVAIGNPLSLESTVSNGIVSGMRTVREEGGKFLQTTAPISPGSSGGPLFNMTGEVVGVTTMYLKGGENLNFAIPINDAKRLLRTDSSKLNDFPNEQAQTPAKDSTASVPVAAGNKVSNARDYYQQLYDSGAFAPESFATSPDGSKISLGRLRNTDYVCFGDDIRSKTFFTFLAWAYDEHYSEAEDKLMTSSTSREERLKLWNTQETIQQGAPYVRFMQSTILNAFPTDSQKFFRSGGRVLVEDVYESGVKVHTLEYHWDGSSWFLPVPPADPKAYTRTSKVLRLSIEPSTMRYVDSARVTMTVGSGETAATDTTSYGPWPGVCEKVPDK